MGWAKRDNGGRHFFPYFWGRDPRSLHLRELEMNKCLTLNQDPGMLGSANRPALNTSPSKRGMPKTVGVLEKKANATVVRFEVVIGRDG